VPLLTAASSRGSPHTATQQARNRQLHLAACTGVEAAPGRTRASLIRAPWDVPTHPVAAVLSAGHWAQVGLFVVERVRNIVRPRYCEDEDHRIRSLPAQAKLSFLCNRARPPRASTPLRQCSFGSIAGGLTDMLLGFLLVRVCPSDDLLNCKQSGATRQTKICSDRLRPRRKCLLGGLTVPVRAVFFYFLLEKQNQYVLYLYLYP
jgi:hypothetical protein